MQIWHREGGSVEWSQYFMPMPDEAGNVVGKACEVKYS